MCPVSQKQNMNSRRHHHHHGFCFYTSKTRAYAIITTTLLILFTDFACESLLLQPPQSRLARSTKRLFLVSDFGAIGDGINDDTLAFKAAWDAACSFPGRARIIIPYGYTFLVHPIDLSGPCISKKITLNIAGAIVAPKDPASWKGFSRRKWIYFHRVNHLTVKGGGTVDGMGKLWWEQSCKRNKTNPCRHAPKAVTFHKCKDLRVNNIKLVNAQQMHLSFANCIRVKASHVTVLSPASSPNTDGIHVSTSRRVEIQNCITRTGDDCISIVGNSSRIRIRNIACGPGHGISIGSLGKENATDQVRDVMVNGAILLNTDNGVRIKSWQGGHGNATKIEFKNIVMENVSNPIIIDQYYCDSPIPCANQTAAVKVENISYRNIWGTSATEEAIKFICSDNMPCKGLYLEDVLLVPSAGGTTKSVCWQAHGTSLGPIYPPPCFSCDDDHRSFIEQKLESRYLQSI